MKYLLGGLWLLLGGLYLTVWNNAQNTCCAPISAITTTTTPAVAKVVKKAVGPLVFNWASGAPITNNLFAGYRDSILETLGDNDKLEIVGLYTKDEENTSSFDNMGLARANETKKLFLEKLPADRIALKARLADVAHKDGSFAAAEFRALKNTKSIVEVDDKTIIYFPLNSSTKLNSREIEQYLDKIAAKVIESKEIVDLTGHTCNRGNPDDNMRLGAKRAKIIARYLKSKGVPSNQIRKHSMGQNDPMVPNTSEDNRKKNRRTVLKILKQ